jgi:Flp pilus assembly protein CpaB
MTTTRPDLRPALPGSDTDTDPLRSPAARRLRPPRWRDRRLALGVVIVLAAVLVGARVLATGAQTAAVLVAARPLPTGHVLAPGDLRIDRVRLGSAGSSYWPGADESGLTGHPLVTGVGSGDLLPRSAVGQSASPQPTRVVSLPVDPSRLPPLASGDLVDVFATVKPAGGGAGSTVAILRGVSYVGGGDTDSAGTVTVRLQVPVADTGALVRASETADIDIVLEQPAGDDTGDVGGAPVTGITPSP